MNQPFRVEPAMPVGAYQTYEIKAPAATHWSKATCQQVDCPDFLNGWRVRVEGLDPELLHAAEHSSRRYRRLDVGPGETWLVFEAGQPCFRAAAHRRRTGRPELYVVRGGDWRQHTGMIRQHVNADDFVDDWANHQRRIADTIEKG